MPKNMLRVAILLMLMTACGCATPPRNDVDIVVVVPGVGGDIGRLETGLTSQRRSVHVFSWGAPLPLFFLNFSDQRIHDTAEKKLARWITDWRQTHAKNYRLDLVGHSAGCGVILGALARANDIHVDQVVLLAPSVSPNYDLNPAIKQLDGQLHVFYSDRDNLFLKWRTSHYGTYDKVKTQAAGHAGFVGNYPSEKVIQHAYDPLWQSLGNDGGHFGPLANRFVREIVAPLLSQD